MKTIPLTKDQHAIVDDEDYENIARYKWYANVGNRGSTYAASHIQGVPTMMHRFILNAPSGTKIDHVNGNGLDNRRCNLRFASHSDNMRNMRNTGRGSSQYKGVCWVTRAHRWLAQIYVSGHTTYLGHFANEEEAARAYDRAARYHFGEFARTNFND